MPQVPPQDEPKIEQVTRKIWPRIRTMEPFVSGVIFTPVTLVQHGVIAQEETRYAPEALDNLIPYVEHVWAAREYRLRSRR